MSLCRLSVILSVFSSQPAAKKFSPSLSFSDQSFFSLPPAIFRQIALCVACGLKPEITAGNRLSLGGAPTVKSGRSRLTQCCSDSPGDSMAVQVKCKGEEENEGEKKRIKRGKDNDIQGPFCITNAGEMGLPRTRTYVSRSGSNFSL